MPRREVGGERASSSYPVDDTKQHRVIRALPKRVANSAGTFVGKTQVVTQAPREPAGGDLATLESDRRRMRDTWKSYLGDVEKRANDLYTASGVPTGFRKALRASASEGVEGFRNHLQTALQDIAKKGAMHAAGQAVRISNAFAMSMHWKTYQATLTRAGDFRDSKGIRHDLNQMLANPMLECIAAQWDAIFKTEIFESVRDNVMDRIDRLLQDMENFAPQSMKVPVKVQGRVCMTKMAVAVEKLRADAEKELLRKQTEAIRPLVPHIKESLRETYMCADRIRGSGQRDAQKGVMARYLEDKSQEIFQGCADLLVQKLNDGISESCDTLRLGIEDLASQVASNLSILWDGHDEFAKLLPPPSPSMSKKPATGLFTPPVTPLKDQDEDEEAPQADSDEESDSEIVTSSIKSPGYDVFDDKPTSVIPPKDQDEKAPQADSDPESISVVPAETPSFNLPGFLDTEASSISETSSDSETPLETLSFAFPEFLQTEMFSTWDTQARKNPDASTALVDNAPNGPHVMNTVLWFLVYATCYGVFMIPASTGVAVA